MVHIQAQIYDSGDCGVDGDCGNEFQSVFDSIYDGKTLVVRGNVPIKTTVWVKSGRQIVGIADSQSVAPQISFTPNTSPTQVTHLFELQANAGVRTSGITIRDLKLLKLGQSANIIGINILGDD